MERLNGENGLGRQVAVSPARATLPPVAEPVGEIIDTSVASFAAQACRLNVAPPFGVLSARIVPPCFSTMHFTMLRPTPLPSRSLSPSGR